MKARMFIPVLAALALLALPSLLRANQFCIDWDGTNSLGAFSGHVKLTTADILTPIGPYQGYAILDAFGWRKDVNGTDVVTGIFGSIPDRYIITNTLVSVPNFGLDNGGVGLVAGSKEVNLYLYSGAIELNPVYYESVYPGPDFYFGAEIKDIKFERCSVPETSTTGGMLVFGLLGLGLVARRRILPTAA